MAKSCLSLFMTVKGNKNQYQWWWRHRVLYHMYEMDLSATKKKYWLEHGMSIKFSFGCSYKRYIFFLFNIFPIYLTYRSLHVCTRLHVCQLTTQWKINYSSVRKACYSVLCFKKNFFFFFFANTLLLEMKGTQRKHARGKVLYVCWVWCL